MMVLIIPQTIFAQGTYNSNQIIVDFSDEATEQDIQNFLDQVNGTIIDEIDNSIFLIEIASFPIEYTNENGEVVVLYDVVDVIGINDEASEIDDTDLNYDVLSTPMNYDEILESFDIDTYTPIPGYVNEYPGQLSCSSLEQRQKVKVGIIDTGLDPSFEFINDYVVYQGNVFNDEPTATDEHGHGTAVAGIVAGLCKASGITPEYLELYIIKAFDGSGQGSIFDMEKALEMAKDLELNVLNLSWGFRYNVIESGGSLQSFINSTTILSIILNYPEFQNTLIVCGAGNNGLYITGNGRQNGLLSTTNEFNYAPANFYGNENIIPVGALDQNGVKADFSNYNSAIVRLFAPGADILAPGLNGSWFLNNSGTSFSSAIVSGVISQLWVENENWTASNLNDFTVVWGNWNTSTIVGNYDISIQAKIILDKLLDNVIVSGNLTSFSSSGGMCNLNAICNENDYVFFNQSNTNNLSQIHLGKTFPVLYQSDLRLSPNPVKDQLLIELPVAVEGEVVLSIVNSQGQKVFKDKRDFEAKSEKIDFGKMNLPNGVYFLTLELNGNIYSDRFIFCD